MVDKIPKKNKAKFQELVYPIILLEAPEKEDLEQSKYIDNTCHNTIGDSTSVKYVIKIPKFNSGMPEEWIIFVDLVQKALVGRECHYWSTHVQIHKTCIEK